MRAAHIPLVLVPMTTSSADKDPRQRRTSRTQIDPLLGQVIDGEFEMLRPLGGGSHADVFLATQRSMGNRHVALKILSRPYLNLRESDFQRAARALRREGALQGQFHSNCFIDVYSTGTLADERPYLAMEYIQGVTLTAMTAELGRIDVLTAISLAVQVAEGLAELHSHGYVHRDVTPNNVIVSESSLGTLSCKIFDFGTVTKIIDKADGLRRGYDPAHPLGTPAYMSPEQALAEVVDGRADQFALSALLYEMLTGTRHVAIAAPGPRPMLEYLRGRGPIPQTPVDAEHSMPAKLAQSVHRALDRDPNLRFADMVRFAESLTETRRRAMAVTEIKAPKFLKRFFGVTDSGRSE